MRSLPAPFLASPHRGQLAVNGVWEEALSFSPDDLPTASRLALFLADSGEAAFEAFFGNDATFFGLRRCGTPDEVAAFVALCVTLFGRRLSGDLFFAELERGLGMPLGEGEPAFFELGAVNAWKSTGTLRITPAMPFPPHREHPLLLDRRHPKALEVAFTEPIPHWFAFPASSCEPPFALCEQRLAAALDEARRSFSLSEVE